MPRYLKKISKLTEHEPSIIDRFGFAPYKVIIRVVPIVVAAIAIRVTLEITIPGFDGLIPTETVTPFATASMFVIAIILGGVLEDYKDGERLPASIVNSFSGLSDKILYCALKCDLIAKAAGAKLASHQKAAAKEEEKEEEELPTIDSRLVHFEMLTLLANVLEYFAGLRSEAEISSIISVHCQWLSATLHPIQEDTGIEVWEVNDAFKDIREDVARAAVIKRTTFIPSGYSLLQFLVYITIVLTSLASYPEASNVEVPAGGGGRRLSEPAEGDESKYRFNIGCYSNVVIYAFLFNYVLVLINDLEDPFEVRAGASTRARAPHGCPPHPLPSPPAAVLDLFTAAEARRDRRAL